MIKIVFLDIDGTIRNSDKQISEHTKEVLRKVNEQIPVVLCTGRSSRYALGVCEEIGIKGYLIASSGSEIMDTKTGKIIFNTKIDMDDTKKLFQYCKDNNLNFLANTMYKDYQTIDESYNRTTFSDLDEIKYDIDQIVVTSYNYEKMKYLLDTFYDTYSNMFVNYYSKTLADGDLNPPIDYCLDINALGVTKYDGIEKLIKYLNISNDEVLACGDGFNDTEMIKNVGFGVAMGNGVDRNFEFAKYITKTNDEDGVAYILEKVLDGSIYEQ